MIVGSPDRTSTRGPPARAPNSGSAAAITANKGALRRRSCIALSVLCHYLSSLRFCQSFKKKASAIFGDLEAQFQVRRRWSQELRRSRVKQQVRVRQTQPLLWIVMQTSRDLGGIFGGVHFYEDSGLYWVLQIDCKPQ